MARRIVFMSMTFAFDVSTGTPVPLNGRVDGVIGDPAGTTAYEKDDRPMSAEVIWDGTKTGNQLAVDARNALRALFQ